MNDSPAPRPKAPLAIDRVLQILQLLSHSTEPTSLSQLSRALGAPKSSLVSLLRGMAEGNYVAAGEGGYRLGGKAYELGDLLAAARRRYYMSAHYRDHMAALCTVSGETVLYAVLSEEDRKTITYLDIVEGRGAIRISVTIGDRSPLYCTAGGRVLLAEMPDAQVEDYLDKERFEQMTPLTLTGRAAIRRSVDQAREDGYAWAEDEVTDGVTGVATAVAGVSGIAVGTLIITGPTARMQAKRDSMIRELCDTTAMLSRELGGND